jgi:hypothetical protein
MEGLLFEVAHMACALVTNDVRMADELVLENCLTQYWGRTDCSVRRLTPGSLR